MTQQLSLDDAPELHIVGDRLRRARALRKLSQRQLGKRTGLPEVTIQNTEAGRSMPHVQTLVKLCRALNCSADYLLGLKDSP